MEMQQGAKRQRRQRCAEVLPGESEMDEVQEHEGTISSAKNGYAARFLLICVLAATIVLCGWNVRWTSSGPTSVTIVGLNGPVADKDLSAYGMAGPAELASNR
jgi:hypothetical protein